MKKVIKDGCGWYWIGETEGGKKEERADEGGRRMARKGRRG